MVKQGWAWPDRAAKRFRASHRLRGQWARLWGSAYWRPGCLPDACRQGMLDRMGSWRRTHRPYELRPPNPKLPALLQGWACDGGYDRDMRKTTSGLETVGEWERQEQAQKRDPSAGHSEAGSLHELGKTSRLSPAVYKPQATTTPPAWSEMGCDCNSEFRPRNSLNHHGGLILPQRQNVLELGLTCFHSLTQKIRYESLPYLPIPWSSIGYLHCFVRYSSENTTPHT